MAFKKAQRLNVPVYISILGPTGAGKTWTALELAMGLIGYKVGDPIPENKVAFIDSERRRGLHYADIYDDKGRGPLFVYDHETLSAPFTVDKYISLIQEAEKEKYEVCIIDSMSHAWAGPGGILELVEQEKKKNKGGNEFAAWEPGTKAQNNLVNAIFNAEMNIICCMRAKMSYQLQENNKGRLVPVKLGTKPIQRDDVEYEFDLVLDMQVDNNTALVVKDNSIHWQGQAIEKPSREIGFTLHEWAMGGKDKPKPPSIKDRIAAVATPRINLTENGFQTQAELVDDIESYMNTFDWPIERTVSGFEKHPDKFIEKYLADKKAETEKNNGAVSV